MYDSSTWRIAHVDGKFKLASVQADNVSLLLDEEEEATMRINRNLNSNSGAACDMPEA